jgi:hypothetical protein
MQEYIRGATLSIWLRSGAQESWAAAERGVPGNRSACPAQFRARMNQLAETGRLRSPDHMNHEGDGIYAIKATCGLRAYGWHSSYKGRRAFIISHVVLKSRQRLDPADKARALTARAEFDAESTRARRSTGEPQ